MSKIAPLTTLSAIRSTRVLVNGELQPATVLIEQGKISNIAPYDYQLASEQDAAFELLDVADQCVLPGIVDTHVHINEPGRTDWEGFDTATHAAAAGGITTLVDMPLNCIPVTINAEAFDEKLAVIGDKLWVDAGFWGGATADNLDDLDSLLDKGVLGVKSFTIHSGIDEFKHVNEAQLTNAMRKLAQKGLVHLIHAEVDDGKHDDDHIGSSYINFLNSRPSSWEDDAISMVVRVMRQLKAEGLEPHAHIVHLSAASALPIIREARAEGLNLTVETCPHYLTFQAETIPDGKTTFKCCPPIRDTENCEALWAALKDGTIDCIVSDHSPCTPQLKHIDSGDLEAAWGGISGLQFGLSLIHNEAIDRGFSLAQLSNLMSTRSAEIAGIADRKGDIKVGLDADFCIFDAEASYTICPEMIHHKHKVTPYEGKTVKGQVRATVLGGKLVYAMQDNDTLIGQFFGKAQGRPVFSTPNT